MVMRPRALQLSFGIRWQLVLFRPRCLPMRDSAADGLPPLKDPDAAHPVASAWRPLFRSVVQCFVQGDYELGRGVPGVEPVDAATAAQIRAYVADYGATLRELPEDTWASSVAQWMETHWDVLIDLWSVEEGRSDLVLRGRVVESSTGPRLTVEMVYVP